MTTARYLAGFVGRVKYPIEAVQANGGQWSPSAEHPSRYVFPDGSALTHDAASRTWTAHPPRRPDPPIARAA